MTVFLLSNLAAYSLVEHKEERFVAVVLPLGGIFYATAWLAILQVERNVGKPDLKFSLFKSACKLATIFYIGHELRAMSSNGTETFTGIDYIYGLLHGRSTKIIEYTDLDESEEIEHF